MRMMLRVLMDTQRSNEMLTNGKMSKLMDTVTERLKPEAAYFTLHSGRRSCIFVMDVADSSSLPALVEPLFQEWTPRSRCSPS